MPKDRTNQTSGTHGAVPSPASNALADAMSKAWRVPEFRVRDKKDFTEFVFRLPYSLARKIRKQDPDAFHRIFPTGREGWRRALRKAHRDAIRNGKHVKNELDALLREIVAKVVQIPLEIHEESFHQGSTNAEEDSHGLRRKLIKRGSRVESHSK
jgi:hypothetical protein